MKKIKTSTLRVITDSVLGMIIGTALYYLYRGGIWDIRWWIGFFGSMSVLHTYNHIMDKLDKREWEELNNKD